MQQITKLSILEEPEYYYKFNNFTICVHFKKGSEGFKNIYYVCMYEGDKLQCYKDRSTLQGTLDAITELKEKVIRWSEIRILTKINTLKQTREDERKKEQEQYKNMKWKVAFGNIVICMERDRSYKDQYKYVVHTTCEKELFSYNIYDSMDKAIEALNKLVKRYDKTSEIIEVL